MKKAISPVTVSCGMAVMALLAMVGGGVAQASPDVTGHKYSDASSTLSSAGYKVVVSTSFGDRLAQADCVVVNQHDAKHSMTNSHANGATMVLVSLNCTPPKPAA
jgi:beta-lactam-binding protein with PASTA domain